PRRGRPTSDRPQSASGTMSERAWRRAAPLHRRDDEPAEPVGVLSLLVRFAPGRFRRVLHRARRSYYPSCLVFLGGVQNPAAPGPRPFSDGCADVLAQVRPTPFGPESDNLSVGLVRDD